MPRLSASAVGPSNAFGSMMETAIPSAFVSIARRIAFTISPTLLLTEPVHSTVAPTTAAASSLPFFAGTKKGFVSAWLTKTKRHFGCDCGKSSRAAFARSGTAMPAAAAAASRSTPARSSSALTSASAGRARASPG